MLRKVSDPAESAEKKGARAAARSAGRPKAAAKGRPPARRDAASAGEPSARTKILNTAYDLVMIQGFAGTSIDMILDASGLTKGAFFYHFKSKSALGVALAKKYVDQDNNFFHGIYRIAEAATSDPLERILIFLDRLADEFEKRGQVPGCLFASFSYDQHTPEMAQFMDEQVQRWRNFYARLFRQVTDRYELPAGLTEDQLADHFLTTVEGGYLLSRFYRRPSEIATHLRVYRHYLALLFADAPAAAGAGRARSR